MIFWSLDLVSKHESNIMESRSRLEIREWSYDNLDLVSPGESKKNNSQSRLEKLHLLSRVGVRFLICIWVFEAKSQFFVLESRLLSIGHLARRDWDYHMTILVFRDENEIIHRNSCVSRRDRDLRKSFLMVEKKWGWLSLRISGVENSRWALLWSELIDFAGTSKNFLNFTFLSTHFENSHMLPTGPSCLKLNQTFKNFVLKFAPGCPFSQSCSKVTLSDS